MGECTSGKSGVPALSPVTGEHSGELDSAKTLYLGSHSALLINFLVNDFISSRLYSHTTLHLKLYSYTTDDFIFNFHFLSMFYPSKVSNIKVILFHLARSSGALVQTVWKNWNKKGSVIYKCVVSILLHGGLSFELGLGETWDLLKYF